MAMAVRAALSCNACAYALDGSVYRTSCRHVFCSDCSHTLFARSQKCPVCGARLGEGNIAEAVVGVQGPLMQETLFSFALQSNDWTSILDNVAKVQALAAELSEFARHQLLQDHLRLVDSTNQVSGHYEAQKTELSKAAAVSKNYSTRLEQKLRELEHAVKSKTDEMEDLKGAYVEKSKRCLAWEKAYGQLSDQLGGGAAGVGSPGEASFFSPKPDKRGAGEQVATAFLSGGFPQTRGVQLLRKTDVATYSKSTTAASRFDHSAMDEHGGGGGGGYRMQTSLAHDGSHGHFGSRGTLDAKRGDSLSFFNKMK